MRLQPAALFAAALAALSGVPAAAQFTRRHGALRALAVADGDADAVAASRQLEEDVVVIDLAAEDDTASLSMSMGAATEFFMAAKAGKADGGPVEPPSTPAPTTSKAAKADDETAAKSEKSGKSDLSYSMSLSSKSGKSKSAKTQAPTPCVNPEVPSAKASKSKSAKSDGSYSFSYGLDGSSKSGKADGLSFSMSLPSKSGKSKSGEAAKSAKGAGTKASKSIIPCVTDAPTDSPTTSPTEKTTTCDIPECAVGTSEGECCLKDGDDPFDPAVDINGGCNVSPPAFGRIENGETICGVTSTYTAPDGSGRRDTDWYLFEHLGGPVTATITSLAPLSVIVGFIEGVPECSDSSRILFDAESTNPPTTTTVTATTFRPAGEYVVFVSINAFSADDLRCGSASNEYTVSLCLGDSCSAPIAPVEEEGVADLAASISTSSLIS